MKYIVVIIPKFKYYTIIFEDEFIEHDEFKTQNIIIQILKLLRLGEGDFTCDLLYRPLLESKASNNERL